MIETDALRFHLREGKIIFKKENFKPEGELFVYSQNHIGFENSEQLPFSYYQQEFINKPKNDFERKILKNLPFARRGFIFKNKDLKNYFETMDWYIPDASYVPDLEKLHQIEKEWISKW